MAEAAATESDERAAEFAALLLDPGADVFMMDEAHMIKNEKSKLAQALSRVRTRRRVLLTGTPLQNNLVEYYHMVNSVKPGELGDVRRFKMLFGEIINQGRVKATDSDQHKSKAAANARVWVLTQKLDKLVQRRGTEILQRDLPRLSSFVLTVRQSELQRKLYNARLARVGGTSNKLFSHKEDMLRIFNHPATLLLQKAEGDTAADASARVEAARRAGGVGTAATEMEDEEAEEEEAVVLDGKAVEEEPDEDMVLEGVAVSKPLPHNTDAPMMNGVKPAPATEDAVASAAAGQPGDANVSPKAGDKGAGVPPWWHGVLSQQEREGLQARAELSGKAEVALEVIRLAAKNDEKVLLFSQSLQTLQVFEEILQREPTPRSGERGFWQAGLDYLRLDGQTPSDERERMMAHFSSPTTKVRLFLMSTKAGGVGLNLTAASRVILFDANWNPSHDVQAICRAYRYGQRRPVYVYRLIAQGWEEVMYRQQVVKLQLAGRVLDDQTLEAMYTQEELQAYLDPLPETPPADLSECASFSAESWLPSLCAKRGADWLLGVEDHNLLMEDTEEAPLSRSEQEDAANDLIRDANRMQRESTFCMSCTRPKFGLRFSQLSYSCECGAVCDLPPAPPVVVRGPEVSHKQLRWSLHGEQPALGIYTPASSLLEPGGVYHVQWRVVPHGEAVGTEDGWQDAKHAVAPTRELCKSNLVTNAAYQVRVRARLGGCNCNVINLEEDDRPKYLQCDCAWTPFSLPSALATPTDANADAF